MSNITRRHFSPEEKVAILKKHLLEQVPISSICDEYHLQPTVFYRWRKEFFENRAAAFERQYHESIRILRPILYLGFFSPSTEDKEVRQVAGTTISTTTEFLAGTTTGKRTHLIHEQLSCAGIQTLLCWWSIGFHVNNSKIDQASGITALPQ